MFELLDKVKDSIIKTLVKEEIWIFYKKIEVWLVIDDWW